MKVAGGLNGPNMPVWCIMAYSCDEIKFPGGSHWEWVNGDSKCVAGENETVNWKPANEKNNSTAHSTYYKSDRLKLCYWDKTTNNGMGGWGNCSIIDYAEKPDIWEINWDNTIIKRTCNNCPDKIVTTYTVLEHISKNDFDDPADDDEYYVSNDKGQKLDLSIGITHYHEIVITTYEVINGTRRYKTQHYYHIIN